MKEINGTITLAYLEEDNKQRVIFRVVPLCTREGNAFHGDQTSFPDEGSMRVVPDKREQSTFKERMREIGSLCGIYLVNDGKELMKVRPNRNYAPDQGERNQLAIYSDVICEFTDDGCFEVVEPEKSAENALTRQVLVYKDKLLYGPVDRESAQSASLSELKPFGNDQFLLHTVDAPSIGQHRIYWNPDATINWRQRRNSLRRRDKTQEAPTAEPDAATKPTEPVAAKSAAPKAAQVKPEAEKPAPLPAAEPATAQPAPAKIEAPRAENRSRVQERAAKETVEAAPAVAEEEKALPIGARLDILDTEMPFEEQIGRLAQPLSESANRLTDLPEEPEEEPDEVVAHFKGTPLTQVVARPKRNANAPDTVHRVVEQQLRGQRDEVMGAEIGESAYGMIENPIETLQSCIDYIWQNQEIRKQAIDALMGNDGFKTDMVRALRQSGLNLQATAAAQEQLSEIEAERIGLLMQLETAKSNEAKFREEAIAALSQKKREESERLKREVEELKKVQRGLSDQARTLSEGNAQKITDFLAQNMTCLTGAGDRRILLAPVLGHDYTPKELAEQLRVHMNDSGFSLSEDDAMSLLINFSLCDSLCFRGESIEDAKHFARILLESFGLQSVSAVVDPGAYVEMISLLKEDLNRTPTVTVQPLGTETMTVYGHMTVFLTDSATLPEGMDETMSCPVVNIPPLSGRAFGYADEWETIAPASLKSFASVRADSHPMMEEAEKWFAGLSQALSERELKMPESSLQCMRRFIEIASRKVRGGFLAAADNAVAYWVVPMLILRKASPEKLAGILTELPHTMNLLGIR